MPDNVIPLNNITKLDLPPDRVLESAIGEMDAVVLIGWSKNGELYFASSIADGGEVNWLLDKAKMALLGVEI